MKLDDAEPTKKPAKRKTIKVVEKLPELAPKGFFEITGLPSQGKLYPKGTQIFSRPLKILEVKQLTTINENNFDGVINNVLKSTVKGIEIDELCPADKMFIIFWQGQIHIKAMDFLLILNVINAKRNQLMTLIYQI